MAHAWRTDYGIRAFALALAIGAAALASAAGAAEGELVDRIVAVVNDDVVLLSELERETETIRANLQARGAQLPPERLLSRQVLERLIALRLQTQIAARNGIEVSDDELNLALNDIAQRNGMTLAELPAAVERQGLAWADYRAGVREDMLLERVRRQEVERRVVVTPREIDQFLAGNEKADDSEYNVSHILIAIRGQATPEEVERNRERAEATYQHVTQKGNDFAQTATSYSDAPDALEGGSLGWRKRTQLPTVFADRVAEMKPGDVTPPFRSGSGFHIMRLNEVRSSQPVVVTQTHARHILLRPNQVVSDQQARERLVEYRKEILGGADFAVVARLYSEDPGSRAEGGDLGWATPGTFVPEFQAVLDTLEPNEISEPFKTSFGWHIVQLLEKREQDVTDQARRNRAMAQIRQRKLEEQMQLWLQRLRDEAYLEIKLEG
jgi:peptidyl-prolyl cis-trans isomerase SurA